MEDKSALFSSAIADYLHLDIKKHLPGYAATEVIEDPESLIKSGIIDPAFAFEEVHYSWVIDFLAKKSDFERRLYSAVLPAKLASAVARRFNLSPIERLLSPLMRRMIFERLYCSLFPHAKVPPLQWTKEPMNRLVFLGKVALERLCDFLGLYDLAAEMQMTIDKTVIEKIQEKLSAKEVMFLKRALGEKQSWSLPKIGLVTWTKASPGLRHVLQKRGLMRLCVALSGESPWLIEHLKYKLDTGRAHIMDQLVRPEMIPGATPTVQSQLEAIFESLNTTSSEVSL